MPLTVASWNIEKNGRSSDPGKQQKVSGFIDYCCEHLRLSVVFLCEVHSARIDDYVDHLKAVHGDKYDVVSFDGGHSNAYVLMLRKEAKIELSFAELKGLNRKVVFLQLGDLFLVLAHFKSGQIRLTKDQLENAAGYLQGVGDDSGIWAITGDMNWDYSRFSELSLPRGAAAYTCWKDQTQAKGGILDWCLAGSGTKVEPADVAKLFPPETEVNDMKGPDHRPVIFALG